MSRSTIRDHEDSVRRYYEANTGSFNAWESRWSGLPTRQPLAIHRRIDCTVDTAHQRIREAAEGCLAVFDLGCGTGAALWSLQKTVGAEVELFGVTLSPSQAVEASTWLGHRAQIVTGSYLQAQVWPASSGRTLYYAIESLAHNPDPELFRSLLTQQARPGDRFLLIDDLLAREPADTTEERWLAAFRDGWKVPALEKCEGWKSGLGNHGWTLVADEDWSERVGQGGCSAAGALRWRSVYRPRRRCWPIWLVERLWCWAIGADCSPTAPYSGNFEPRSVPKAEVCP